MNVKEYLGQLNDIRKRVNEKQKQIEMYRDQLVNITASTDGERVQTFGSHDKTGGLVANIVDRENEINSLLIDYMRKDRVISAQIESLPTSKYREVLHWRYIMGYTFERTAVEMDKTWRYVISLHGDALMEFEKIYKKVLEKA